MDKRLMTLVAGLTLSTGMAFAQSQISGKVTSSEDGSPVIGASIKVAGTNTGTCLLYTSDAADDANWV